MILLTLPRVEVRDREDEVLVLLWLGLKEYCFSQLVDESGLGPKSEDSCGAPFCFYYICKSPNFML